MTLTELKNKIKVGDLGGAYIFAGEEDYLKKYYLSEIVKLCCPDEAFSLFNRVVFDGADIDLAEIAEAIKAPPMMSDLKLIEWKYPDLDKMKESDKKTLISISESLADYPYITLVLFSDIDGFDPGTAKRPSKNAKLFSKSFNLINFEKSTDAQLISWLKRHFDAEKIECDVDTLSALIFRSGHSMSILAEEVKKLSAYAKANTLPRITKKEVDFVASSTLECDAFALSGAITDKNRERAFTALADMAMRRIEAGAVLATLSRSFGELVTVALLLEEGKDAKDIEGILGWNQYKIKICISSAQKWGVAKLSLAMARLRELDAESKSGGITGYKAIELFICQYI
ncbi:MAG: DNA polymerase III subunit delta [Ruminococcaceae bacterium]|nr:DNA polymerase III subunit delta [Oscillospiraceae bacterium]